VLVALELSKRDGYNATNKKKEKKEKRRKEMKTMAQNHKINRDSSPTTFFSCSRSCTDLTVNANC
jgi:hypothetical protein